jgi:hypothetical protein
MLAAIILYNWTEAAIKAYHPLWFLFCLIAMGYPRTRLTAEEPSGETATSEERRELAYAGEEF